jgi:hypothetical protein
MSDRALTNRRTYDDPSLSPIEFLHAVMHDTATPVWLRVDVASWLLHHYPELSQPPAFTIRINGARAADLGPGAHGSTDFSSEKKDSAEKPLDHHHEDPGPKLMEKH